MTAAAGSKTGAVSYVNQVVPFIFYEPGRQFAGTLGQVVIHAGRADGAGRAPRRNGQAGPGYCARVIQILDDHQGDAACAGAAIRQMRSSRGAAAIGLVTQAYVPQPRAVPRPGYPNTLVTQVEQVTAPVYVAGVHIVFITRPEDVVRAAVQRCADGRTIDSGYQAEGTVRDVLHDVTGAYAVPAEIPARVPQPVRAG